MKFKRRVIFFVKKVIFVESNIFNEMNFSSSKIVYFSLIVIVVINVNTFSRLIVKFMTQRCLKHMRVSFAFQRSKIENV